MNRAFREAQGIFGENAGLFAGLALVFGIPGAIAEMFTKGGEGGMMAILLPVVVASLFAAVSEAAITLGAISRVKGEAVGSDILSGALNFYLPVFVALLLGSLVAVLGFLLFVLPGIIATALLFFAIPAIIEERLNGAGGGVKGLERSVTLGAGQRAGIILMVFLFIVFWLGVSLLLQYLLASAPLLAAFAGWLAGGVISAFGTVLAVTSYAQLMELHGTPLKIDTTPQPQ